MKDDEKPLPPIFGAVQPLLPGIVPMVMEGLPTGTFLTDREVLQKARRFAEPVGMLRPQYMSRVATFAEGPETVLNFLARKKFGTWDPKLFRPVWLDADWHHELLGNVGLEKRPSKEERLSKRLRLQTSRRPSLAERLKQVSVPPPKPLPPRIREERRAYQKAWREHRRTMQRLAEDLIAGLENGTYRLTDEIVQKHIAKDPTFFRQAFLKEDQRRQRLADAALPTPVALMTAEERLASKLASLTAPSVDAEAETVDAEAALTAETELDVLLRELREAATSGAIIEEIVDNMYMDQEDEE